MGDTRELKDSVDLDAYYAPFMVCGVSGEIYWFSPVTNEPVMIMKRAYNA